MRCEECLAVIEEYFDGELERRQNERMGAHLAACEDCSEALGALAAEQELYLRYDRGLEASPALWEGVRAGVARLAEVEPTAAPARPLAGLRRFLLAAFAAIVPRTAFAPALALLLLAAFVGALWLAQRPGSNGEMASEAPFSGGRAAAEPQPGATPEPGAPPIATPGVEVATGGAGSPAEAEPLSPAADRGRVDTARTSGARSHGRAPSGDEVAALVPPPAADHLEAIEAEFTRLAVHPVTVASADVLSSTTARLLTPEEKEMARHLEQAQMLLRSFQNEAGTGGDAVQIAYERRLSRKLLAENETLRLGAEAAGDKQTRQVLDTLEPFLLDIANLRDDASRDEVRSIKERMEKKEIIAALHVY